MDRSKSFSIMDPYEKWHFRKNVKKQIWLVLKYVKTYAEFNGDVHFGWSLL